MERWLSSQEYFATLIEYPDLILSTHDLQWSVSSAPEDLMPSSDLLGSRHLSSTQTYMQAEHLYT